MPSILPSPERITEFAGMPPDDGPIVMVNLLRYNERAAYPEGSDAAPCSGREAYQRYSQVAVQKVVESGGRLLWLAGAELSLIAPEGERWDDVALVEYPSRAAFLKMVSMPDYQAAAVHRTAALADSRLIATRTALSALGEAR